MLVFKILQLLVNSTQQVESGLNLRPVIRAGHSWLRLYNTAVCTIVQVETVVSVSPKSNLSFEVLSIQIAREGRVVDFLK